MTGQFESGALILGIGLDWFDHLEQLLPIILVVAIGILTLLKRLFEKIFSGTPAKKSPRRGTQVEQEEEPSVFTEMKKYFEILEGTPRSEETPLDTRGPVAPPTPPPAPSSSPWSEIHPDELLPAESEVVIHDPSRLVADVPPAFKATPEKLSGNLVSNVQSMAGDISVSMAELARGSGPARSRRRTLPRIRLDRGRKQVRSAILWSEILGKPRCDRPF